jgi:D-serine deaminase-like pyridoxal phosphate-dependent protein
LFEQKDIDGEEQLAEAEGRLKRKAMAALQHRQWSVPTLTSQGSWQMTSLPLASDRKTLNWTKMILARYQVYLHMIDF